MQIPILVEPIQGRGFRARTGEPFRFSVEATNKDEARRQLTDLVAEKLRDGAVIELLDVPTNGAVAPPQGAGILKDNVLFDEWQRAIADYRKQIDDDPNEL